MPYLSLKEQLASKALFNMSFHVVFVVLFFTQTLSAFLNIRLLVFIPLFSFPTFSKCKHVRLCWVSNVYTRHVIHSKHGKVWQRKRYETNYEWGKKSDLIWAPLLMTCLCYFVEIMWFLLCSVLPRPCLHFLIYDF
jgi:hypothetical protein